MAFARRSWVDIYQSEIDRDGGDVAYLERKVRKKAPLVSLVDELACARGNAIECGCGTGVIGTYLSSHGKPMCALDIDKGVIEMAGRLSESYAKHLGWSGSLPIEFVQGSIEAIPFSDKSFDVAFSNGVLEHFEDDEIVGIVGEQLRVADAVIVGIPTDYWDPEESKYGDERVMSLGKWRELIERAGGRIIKEVGMHRQPFLARLRNVKKWFRGHPYHLFVVVDGDDERS